MSLLQLSAEELLERFASSDPTPGGGSAAALSGALGAALVAMVCAMPKTRSGTEDERERLDTALGWVREAGARLRRLVDDDTEAYDAVVAAYRLPKASEEEKSRRKQVIATAMQRASDVPMETAEGCLVVLRAAVLAAAHGNPNALSDARTGGALALAGLRGGIENVRINVKGDEVGAGDRLARADAAWADALLLARELGLS
jgi:formiminotetrahydrofolate cyclodeaminase